MPSASLTFLDAIQLTCALALRTSTLAKQVPEPIFVCADNGLLTIAKVEKLGIENSNDYL